MGSSILLHQATYLHRRSRPLARLWQSGWRKPLTNRAMVSSYLSSMFCAQSFLHRVAIFSLTVFFASWRYCFRTDLHCFGFIDALSRASPSVQG